MWEHLNHKEQQESWCKRKKVLTGGSWRFESSGEGALANQQICGVGGRFAEGRKRCKERQRMSEK